MLDVTLFFLVHFGAISQADLARLQLVQQDVAPIKNKAMPKL